MARRAMKEAPTVVRELRIAHHMRQKDEPNTACGDLLRLTFPRSFIIQIKILEGCLDHLAYVSNGRRLPQRKSSLLGSTATSPEDASISNWEPLEG